jgi:hypothetical protein
MDKPVIDTLNSVELFKFSSEQPIAFYGELLLKHIAVGSVIANISKYTILNSLSMLMLPTELQMPLATFIMQTNV